MTGKEQTVCRFQQIESRWGYSGTADKIRSVFYSRICKKHFHSFHLLSLHFKTHSLVYFESLSQTFLIKISE